MKFVNWQLHLKFRSHFFTHCQQNFNSQSSLTDFSPLLQISSRNLFSFYSHLLAKKKHNAQKNQVITMAGSVRIKTCDLDLMQEPQVNLLSENAKLSFASQLTHHNSSFFFLICCLFDSLLSLCLYRNHQNNREPSIISTRSYEIKPKIRRENFFFYCIFFSRSPYFCTTKEIFPKFYLFVCETIENDPFYF